MHAAKQSTLTTFLEDAQKTGNLTIYEKAHVNKVRPRRLLHGETTMYHLRLA